MNLHQSYLLTPAETMTLERFKLQNDQSVHPNQAAQESPECSVDCTAKATAST